MKKSAPIGKKTEKVKNQKGNSNEMKNHIVNAGKGNLEKDFVKRNQNKQIINDQEEDKKDSVIPISMESKENPEESKTMKKVRSPKDEKGIALQKSNPNHGELDQANSCQKNEIYSEALQPFVPLDLIRGKIRFRKQIETSINSENVDEKKKDPIDQDNMDAYRELGITLDKIIQASNENLKRSIDMNTNIGTLMEKVDSLEQRHENRETRNLIKKDSFDSKTVDKVVKMHPLQKEIALKLDRLERDILSLLENSEKLNGKCLSQMDHIRAQELLKVPYLELIANLKIKLSKLEEKEYSIALTMNEFEYGIIFVKTNVMILKLVLLGNGTGLKDPQSNIQNSLDKEANSTNKK